MARGVGRGGPRRAQLRPRPSRLRAPSRVLVVLRAVVRDRGRRTALRRLPSAQPGYGRLLQRRRSTPRRCHLRPRRPGAVAGRARCRVGHGRRSRLDPRPTRREAEHPVIPTTIRSGPDWPNAAFPSCSTSAAAVSPSAVSGCTTGARRPSSSAALRSSARRTSWSCTTPRLGSCRCSCSTACSSVIRVSAAARSRWVPDGCPTMLRRLDHADRHLESLASRGSRRSSGLRRSRRARSCASRPIRSKTSARIAAESDPRLYLFSSDYPHAEGGRDPLGRFERSWAGTPGTDDAVTGFFAVNAAGWLGVEQPA